MRIQGRSGYLKWCGYLAGIIFTPRTWEDRAKLKGATREQKVPLGGDRSCRVSFLFGWGRNGG